METQSGKQFLLTYEDLARELVAYVKDMGFTHIEFLPVSEYPFDGSWGYQATGLYAPTSRFGSPEELRALIKAAHDAGISVILDWVVGHSQPTITVWPSLTAPRCTNMPTRVKATIKTGTP